MKNKILFNVFVILFIVFSTQVVADTKLSIQPANSFVSYNDDFLVTVKIDTNDSIAGVKLDINFNPIFLEAISQTEGGFLSQDNDPLFDAGNKINNTIGKVIFNMITATPFKGINGSASLVNITFKAVKKNGNSDLTLDNILIGDWDATAIHPSMINNGTVAVATIQNILINEFLPNGDAGEEWAELFNNDNISINISRWTISDEVKVRHTFSDTILEANKHILINKSLGLDNDHDTIYLKDNEGTLIDSYAYAGPGPGNSIGRQRDGSGIWIEFEMPTPNAPNNRLPVGDIAGQTINEDGFGSFNISSYITDPDNDPLTFIIVDENVNKVNCNIINKVNVTLTPFENYYGVANCTVMVNDSYGVIEKLSYIVVNAVNDAPTISGVPNQTAIEDINLTLNITPYINDVDNGTSSLIITEDSPYAIVNGQLIIFNYPEGILKEDVTITVSDGILESSQKIRVLVTPVNDAPTINIVPAVINAIEDVNLILDVTPYINDVDNDISFLIITTNSSYATINAQNIIFNYPNSALTGKFTLKSVRVTVSDGQLNSSQNIKVNITNVNDNPTLAPIADKTAIESVTLAFTLNATDIDPTNDILTFWTNASIANLKLDSTTGLVTVTPEYTDVGVHKILFNVSDGEGGKDSKTMKLTVKSALEISDLDIEVDGANYNNLDDGAVVYAMPGSAIQVDIALKNTINYDIRGVVVNGTIDTELGLIKKSSLIPNMPPQTTHSVALNFNLPNLLTEKLYPLIIKGIGEDENHIMRYAERTVYINLTKKGDDVIVENINLTPSTIACVKNSTLSFNIINRGKYDQNSGNTIKITNELLGINIEDTFSIAKNSSIIKNYSVNTTTTQTGTFPIKLNVTWFYINSIFNTVDLEIIKCIDVPDYLIDEDTTPESNWIDLWNYTNDPNYPHDSFVYSIKQSNETLINCSVNSNRYINCLTPAENQNGYSDINVTVIAGANYNYDTFRLTINPVNDAPIITGIPDVIFDEGGSNSTVDLDNYVFDVDNTKDELVWSVSGNKSVSIKILNDDIVTFSIYNKDWYGNETITFIVYDTDGLNNSYSINVKVNQLVDDLPYIDSSSPQDDKLLTGDNMDIKLNVSVVNPDGVSYTVKWHVDGNEDGSGNTFIFNKAEAGAYNVIANVTNSTETFDTELWTIKASKTPVTDYIGTIKEVNESNVGNFTGLTVYNTNAKIDFGNETINLSDVVDVDSYVILQNGVVGIDSNASGFSVFKSHPATITMYNVDLTEPIKIYYSSGFSLTGKTECPTSICSNIDYNTETKTLRFDVTGFSIFFIGNKAPVANAGNDKTVLQNTLVTLDGSASFDLDGDPLTYSWLQLSGPSTTLSNTTTAKPTFTVSESGVYVFRLIVNDGQINSQPDDVNINVYYTDLDIASVKLISEGKDDELNPGESLTVKIKVENEGDADIEDIKLEMWFVDKDGSKLKDDDDDVIEEDADLELEEGDSETIEFEFNNMPTDFEDGDKYTLHIEVQGRNADNNTITYMDVDESEEIEFVREKHELEIYKAVLTPDSIQCSRNIALEIGVRNIGEKEEDVTLTISNAQLGIDKESTFTLSSHDDDDNENEISYNPAVGDNIEDGLYPITIKASYSGKSETKLLNLEVKGCKKAAEKKEEVLVIKKPVEKEITPKKEEIKKPITISFRDTTAYLALLANTFVLLTGLVIIVVGIAIIRWRR